MPIKHEGCPSITRRAPPRTSKEQPSRTAILGICALFWPSRSLAILITLVGVFILADGVTGLAGALRNWTGSETLLQPVVSMVIGPVLLVWPGASVGLLMVVLGVWAWIYGVSQILEAR